MTETKNLPYDSTNPESIERHALRLKDKSLRQLISDIAARADRNKGGFGQLVEEQHFLYKPNSDARPDFPEAGVELKVTPIKKVKKGYVSKERLVFNIIDYEKENLLSFEQSSFWKKNKLLLLMMYLYEKEALSIDYIFKLIFLWSFPETDMKIIRDDWAKIVGKIKEGKAHELSEGDTLYLGACTKGANKSSLRSQPHSDIKAMQRAYSLKSKYLNFIINKKGLNDTAKIVSDVSEYKPGETFEQKVVRRFERFYGMSEKQIRDQLGIVESPAKNRLNLLCHAILGVKGKRIEEFEKADVLMKTIKLEKSGALKESMSFKQIDYHGILDEDWLDSYWYETLSKRFFFVVFQWRGNELYLKKAMFWNMPHNDIKQAELFWNDVKSRIAKGDYEGFWKISDDRTFHVRPKAKNSKDLTSTPTGTMEKKKAYWLNSSYIKRVISG